MQYKHIQNTERMVKYILSEYPDSRRSDKDLLIAYMSMCGIDLNSYQKAQFKAMPSLESITRCRRKLQEAGQFLPSPQVMRERYEKAKQFEQEAIQWDS